MKQRLQHRAQLKIRHGISVQMKQALHLLTLNSTELSQVLKHELEKNLFLEELAPPRLTHEEFIELQESHQQHRHSSGENALEKTISGSKTLKEFLLEQVDYSSLKPDEKRLAEEIVTTIDEKGFVTLSHKEIATRAGFTLIALSRVLDFIRSLEPTGVCAENIWESLEWQARVRYPKDQALDELITILQQGAGNIDDLEKEHIDEIAELLQLDRSKVLKAIDRLKTLSLFPAANYGKSTHRYVAPDIVFEEKNGKITIHTSDLMLPTFRINKEYEKNLNQMKSNKEIMQMYTDARHLIDQVAYRKSSLLKVAEVIIKYQTPFFKNGKNDLQPLILKDIADETDLNISTISRIMKNKYCQTPQGFFPLSVFLVRKIKGSKTNEEANFSPLTLKKRIQSIVSKEPSEAPYSDSKITEILQSEGYDIQRRTVAKYRKLLHIPSRKQRTVI